MSWLVRVPVVFHDKLPILMNPSDQADKVLGGLRHRVRGCRCEDKVAFVKVNLMRIILEQ